MRALGPVLAVIAASTLLVPGGTLAQGEDPALADLPTDEISRRFDAQERDLGQPRGLGGGAAPARSLGIYVPPGKDTAVNVFVTFDFDSAALRDDQKPKLGPVCDAIRESDIDVFQVVGHTDATGSPEYNDDLSRLRAAEVQSYLVAECGIERSRLVPVGVGMRHLLDESDPHAEENRRVEFRVAG